MRSSQERLSRGSAALARELLAQLRMPRREGETLGDYEERVTKAALGVLGLGKLVEG